MKKTVPKAAPKAVKPATPKKCSYKVDSETSKAVKKNASDMKTGSKQFAKDTMAKAENWVKEGRYKKGYLHEELGQGKGRYK